MYTAKERDLLGLAPGEVEIHRIEEPRSEVEQHLYRQLHELKLRYEAEAKLLIDALVQFEYCKVPRYYITRKE